MEASSGNGEDIEESVPGDNDVPVSPPAVADLLSGADNQAKTIFGDVKRSKKYGDTAAVSILTR